MNIANHVPLAFILILPTMPDPQHQVNNWMMNVRVRRCRTKKIGLATGPEQITYPESQSFPKALAVNRTGRNASSNKVGGGGGGGLALPNSSPTSSASATVPRTKRRVKTKNRGTRLVAKIAKQRSSTETSVLAKITQVAYRGRTRQKKLRAAKAETSRQKKNHTNERTTFFSIPSVVAPPSKRRIKKRDTVICCLLGKAK